VTLEKKTLGLLSQALELLDAGFESMPPFEPEVDLPAIQEVLTEVAGKMRHNFPYPHPLYAGQMLKPPHPVARLAYMLSLWINPNNHALDGGLASSAMEKEAVANLAEMFGWDRHLGHLCGGGTMANLEALWIAGRCQPQGVILASEQAHYTHGRISEVLKLPFESIPVDDNARMDMNALEARLAKGDVGTVVATMGTTSVGAVDPLDELLELRKTYTFRIHADAAYGGYFHLCDNLDAKARAAFDCLDRIDSLVIDPHKHGLQPYGCGCVLFRDPQAGIHYKHDSPYTYFSSKDLHLGEISLECSRPGAAAVALWATQKLLPLTMEGSFARDLKACKRAANALYARLANDPRFLTALPPQLDIVIWVPNLPSATGISAMSEAIFQGAARHHLHLAIANLPKTLLAPYWPDLEWDAEEVTVLRSCLMKPEHEDWLDRIWSILDEVTQTAFASLP